MRGDGVGIRHDGAVPEIAGGIGIEAGGGDHGATRRECDADIFIGRTKCERG